MDVPTGTLTVTFPLTESSGNEISKPEQAVRYSTRSKIPFQIPVVNKDRHQGNRQGVNHFNGQFLSLTDLYYAFILKDDILHYTVSVIKQHVFPSRWYGKRYPSFWWICMRCPTFNETCSHASNTFSKPKENIRETSLRALFVHFKSPLHPVTNVILIIRPDIFPPSHMSDFKVFLCLLYKLEVHTHLRQAWTIFCNLCFCPSDHFGIF